MTKTLLCTALLIAATTGLHAQSFRLLERTIPSYSPQETRHNSLSADMQSRRERQLYRNPAYYGIESRLADTLRQHHRSAVSLTAAGGNTDGDFLPYEGNASRDIRLTGISEYTLKGSGTLFGQVGYARGRHSNVGWNATRQPELYTPYIATDSVGGHFSYEDYRIEGGFAFPLGSCTLGVKGTFSGEQAHRNTDPRALNNTTWLSGEVGIACETNGHLLMAGAGAARNKQHVSLRYWRPGQQDRFFVLYGFGLYDIRQSAVLFGYSRMYYLSQVHGHITYRSPQGRRTEVFASADYQFRQMHAEESDIRNLYSSKTSRLHPMLEVSLRLDGGAALSAMAEASLSRRKGYENIYEDYLSDEANNIYDFRRIDTRQRYVLSQNDYLARLRYIRPLGHRHRVSLEGGTAISRRSEKYKESDHHTSLTSLMPHGRAGWSSQGNRLAFDLGLLCGRSFLTNHSYGVSFSNQSVTRLDFQQAFAPYAYHAADYTVVQMDATCLRRLKTCAVGARLKLGLISGQRKSDVAYTDVIGFASSAPMVSPLPSRHDEQWGSCTLFVEF